MKFLIIGVLFLATSAWGTGNGSSNPNSNSSSNSHSVSTTHVAALAQSKAQAASVAQGGSAQSEGGTASALAKGGMGGAGGSSEGGSAEASGGTASNEGITYNNEQVRQAPSIGLVTPQSTMECSKGFGWGGSNKTGSIVMGISWLQKDCVASHEFVRLAELGLTTPAAKVYCARKLFNSPFDTEQQCIDAITTALQATHQKTVVNIAVEDGQKKCELLATGKDSIIREITDDGVELVYDCQEYFKGS